MWLLLARGQIKVDFPKHFIFLSVINLSSGQLDANFDLGSSPEITKDGFSEDLMSGGTSNNVGGEAKRREKTSKRIKRAHLHADPEDHVRQQIPNTTKKSTEYAVNLYNSIMQEVAIELSFDHQKLQDVPLLHLPYRLSKFFMVVSKADGNPFNASSLETIFASLARFLSSEYDPKIDIKTDVRFKIVRESVDAAQKESTGEGQRPGKHKARAFQDEHIAKCWRLGSLGRKNPRALVSTVHFTLISNLGFRGNLEIYNIRNEDIIIGPVGKGGVPEWIELSERITKTRKGGSHNIRELDPKVFADHENPQTCPVRTFMEFKRRKTALQNHPEKPFFCGVKASAEKNPENEEFWYINVRMGTHAIGKLLSNVFEAVGIDVKLEHYSNTSARKTLMEGGIEAGVPGVLLSKVAGQKCLGSISHYVQGERKGHKALSLCISRKVGANPGSRYDQVYQGVAEEELEKIKQLNKLRLARE